MNTSDADVSVIAPRIRTLVCAVRKDVLVWMCLLLQCQTVQHRGPLAHVMAIWLVTLSPGVSCCSVRSAVVARCSSSDAGWVARW